jgi:hypothetical protein
MAMVKGVKTLVYVHEGSIQAVVRCLTVLAVEEKVEQEGLVGG